MSTIQNHCSDDEANSWRNKSAVHRKIQFCNMTSVGRTATPPLRHTHTHMEHTRIHTLWVAHGVYLTPLRLSQHPMALTCQRSRSQASQPASQPAIVAGNLTVTAATVTAVVSCCCCCCLCHGAVQRCSFAGFRLVQLLVATLRLPVPPMKCQEYTRS